MRCKSRWLRPEPDGRGNALHNRGQAARRLYSRIAQDFLPGVTLHPSSTASTSQKPNRAGGAGARVPAPTRPKRQRGRVPLRSASEVRAFACSCPNGPRWRVDRVLVTSVTGAMRRFVLAGVSAWYRSHPSRGNVRALIRHRRVRWEAEPLLFPGSLTRAAATPRDALRWRSAAARAPLHRRNSRRCAGRPPPRRPPPVRQL